MQKEQTGTALRQLKADIAAQAVGRLYFFHGEESYLRDYYLGELRRALIPEGLEAFNYHLLAGKGLTAEELEQAADNFPMMSERTLLVVEDYDLFKAAEAERERMCALLSSLPEYCCLIFVYDMLEFKPDKRMKKLYTVLEKHGQTIAFVQQSQNDLLRWVRRRFAALEKEISSGDAEYLLFLCGGLMTNLISEIEKIGAYAKGRVIERSDIDMVASPVLDAQVFQLVDTVLMGKYAQAVGSLADLLRQQEEPIPIVALLGRQLRQLYTARLALDEGKDAAYLATLWARLSPWAARRLMENARRYCAAWYRQAVILCAQTDYELKSGGDGKGLLIALLPRLAALEAA